MAIINIYKLKRVLDHSVYLCPISNFTIIKYTIGVNAKSWIHSILNVQHYIAMLF